MKLHNIFIIVLIIGLLARIFSLIVLPEEAYSDALYHLLLAKQIVIQQAISFTGFIPGIPFTDTPLYHLLVSIDFVISNASFQMPFIRIIPIALIGLQLLLSFLILKKFFKENFIVGLSLIAVFPWLIRYGAVNYLDTLASVLVLFCVYLLMKFNETKKQIWIVVFFSALVGMILSSLVILFAIPVFVVAVLFLVNKHFPIKSINSTKLIHIFVLLMVILSFVSVAKGFIVCHKFSCAVSENDPGINPTFNNPNVFTKEFLTNSYLSFFDFPTEESFERVSFLQSIPFGIIIPVFVLITLPIFLLIIFGAVKFLKEKDLIRIIIVLLVLSVIAIAFYITLVDNRAIELFYVRFLIAIMPLLGILFAKGFLELKQAHFRKIAAISLLLFAFYSLAFTGVSAAYYNSIEQKHQGLYIFAKTLPENVKIYSKIKSRAIEFNAARNAGEIIEYDKDFYSQNNDYIYSKLKENSFTHLVEECYRNPWKQKTINELIDSNKIIKVFEDVCVKVYEIK